MSILVPALIAALWSFPQEPPPRRPLEVAVTVVTLDSLRQGQARYGGGALAALGDGPNAPLTLGPSTLTADLFGSCLDERMGQGLDYCIRFYLTRAEFPADAPPPVVVVFDDDPGPASRGYGEEELRVTCFGRGLVPADAAAQDTWMWPGAARMHGVRDLQRDEDALAACIAAAASEPFAGLRQPDPR
ncbi:MAG TPA: hypothetical protein VGE54_02600 [Brevundimonas sp.]